jgi:putative ABC transport system substrate-binding protein
MAAGSARAARERGTAHRHRDGERGERSGRTGARADFLQALSDLGWNEHRNLRVEYRWGAGEPDRAHAYAAELAADAPDVVLANGSPALRALQHATRSIPVVFVVVTDPVGAGFVQRSLRPHRPNARGGSILNVHSGLVRVEQD